MPLVTVFANSLRQAYPFRNRKPATNVRYYDNIGAETTLRVLEARLAPPNGEMRINLP